MADETKLISLEEYNRLLSDSAQLAALEAAGVDNWEGYHHIYDHEMDCD